MSKTRRSDDDGTRGRPARSGAEWVTFAVSLFLLGVVIALIAAQIPGEHTPAAPTATRAGPIRSEGGSFFVPVDVKNTGEDTAQNVQVLATLTTTDGKEIVADQLVDFLAGGETERIEFAFAEDPADGDLTVSVSGFGVP